jgi:predicted AlkP superfamily pyrophosphatase or phosphodiesterase
MERRLSPAGFKYFLDHGVCYTNAHFEHCNTFTASGHATLFTGAHTAQHGIAGNDWLDRRTGKHVYSFEDANHTIIGREPKPHSGTSPRNLTSSTTGDELWLASGGKAKVFSVSIKDRAAICSGGHRGKSFWYSSSTGQFVSSTYYFDDYPEWVVRWNAAGHAESYREASWELLHDKSIYFYGDQDDRACEKSYGQLGRVFPHSLADEGANLYSTLRFTPFGDELTVKFVKRLIEEEELGKDDVTDFLAVSLSDTDYIGHAFGPNSLEFEDNVLQVDIILGGLLSYLDNQVGLTNCLLALHADHGIAPVPEYTRQLGFDAHRLDPGQFITRANQVLRKRFGVERDLVLAFWNPGVYLDRTALGELKLEAAEVERALADELMEVPGIAMAIPRSDLLRGLGGGSRLHQLIQNGFHPQRSGDVMIVQQQFAYLDSDPEGYAAMHGSPYTYDTHVPLMFAGPGIPAGRRVSRQVAPCDVAPTIAQYIGIQAPSGSVGAPLEEVVGGVAATE